MGVNRLMETIAVKAKQGNYTKIDGVYNRLISEGTDLEEVFGYFEDQIKNSKGEERHNLNDYFERFKEYVGMVDSTDRICSFFDQTLNLDNVKSLRDKIEDHVFSFDENANLKQIRFSSVIYQNEDLIEEVKKEYLCPECRELSRSAYSEMDIFEQKNKRFKLFHLKQNVYNNVIDSGKDVIDEVFYRKGFRRDIELMREYDRVDKDRQFNKLREVLMDGRDEITPRSVNDVVNKFGSVAGGNSTFAEVVDSYIVKDDIPFEKRESVRRRYLDLFN